MSDTPKVIWAWESLVGDARIPENLWSIKSTPFSSLGDRATEYVRKDISDELEVALTALDREFADQAIAEAEYLAEEGNHAMQECANRSASVWLKARAALAKYRETET